MGVKFANNAAGVLAADLSDTSTTLTVRDIDLALFPDISGPDDYFYLTLFSLEDAGRKEIVECQTTNVNGWNVLRGREETPPLAWPAGTLVELRFTNGAMIALAAEVASAAVSEARDAATEQVRVRYDHNFPSLLYNAITQIDTTPRTLNFNSSLPVDVIGGRIRFQNIDVGNEAQADATRVRGGQPIRIAAPTWDGDAPSVLEISDGTPQTVRLKMTSGAFSTDAHLLRIYLLHR